MTLEKLVCTACACLCDDILVEINDNRITSIKNACITGSSFIFASQSNKKRASYHVAGQSVSYNEAIKKASSLLKNANSPMLFGFDKSTMESQVAAIELAETLNATIDDNSSFCKGALIDTIINEINPTCSFNEASEADLLLFWGSNPYHSHPRHLSHLSYYTHTKYRPEGWFPDLHLIYIDVRETEIQNICDQFINIKPGEDQNFISSVLSSLNGNSGSEDVDKFVTSIKNSNFCVIYAGLGLDYSLNSNYELFTTMVKELGKSTRIAVIPMIGHYNMLGFNHSLFLKTHHINKVNFDNGITYGDNFSFLEQIRKGIPDCVLIAGSDPLTSLPESLAQNLKKIPIITIDPFISPTTEISEVVLGTSISGLENSGNAIRMDGTKISFMNPLSSSIPGDEEIIKELTNMVKS